MIPIPIKKIGHLKNYKTILNLCQKLMFHRQNLISHVLQINNSHPQILNEQQGKFRINSFLLYYILGFIVSGDFAARTGIEVTGSFAT